MKKILYLEFLENLGIFYENELAENKAVFLLYFKNDKIYHQMFFLPDSFIKIKGQLTSDIISKISPLLKKDTIRVFDSGHYGETHNIGLIKYLQLCCFFGVLRDNLISEDLYETVLSKE